MRVSELIEELEFGSDVAETDKFLQQCFVSTYNFRELIAGQTHLVLGTKGSGKTVMLRVLAAESAKYLPDTDVVPAFNVQGDVMYQELQDYVELPEATLKTFWTAFTLGLAGKHLLEAYPRARGATELARVLRIEGLVAANESGSRTRETWESVLHRFGRLAEPTAVEGKIGLSPTGGQIEGRFEYQHAPENTESRALPSRINVAGVLKAIQSVLNEVDRRLWMLFDRLDEAFEGNRPLERKAIRALMRSHMDLNTYDDRFSTKMFLRNDVLDRGHQGRGVCQYHALATQRYCMDPSAHQ